MEEMLKIRFLILLFSLNFSGKDWRSNENLQVLPLLATVVTLYSSADWSHCWNSLFWFLYLWDRGASVYLNRMARNLTNNCQEFFPLAGHPNSPVCWRWVRAWKKQHYITLLERNIFCTKCIFLHLQPTSHKGYYLSQPCELWIS